MREARRGEQIEDLFVLVDSVIGSVGVELAEGVPSGEFDDLAAVLTHVCARHRVNIFIVSSIVFIQVERNQCVRNDVVVACFKRDACCSGVKR
ncbi:hypothetical protein, partial [Haladaptatus sp. NG-WS-4]